MLNRTKTFSATMILALGSALALGCAGSDGDPVTGGPRKPAADESAVLTIVGDVNLFLEPSQKKSLAVKYHDETGGPLAGEISFVIDGASGGAVLSAAKATTDAQGVARVDLTAGTQETAFRVKVSAELASGVDWRISVTRAVAPVPPLLLKGDFKVESTLDIGGGLPGTVGNVVRTLDDLTNSPYDPASFIIDFALAKVNNSTVTSAVNRLRPGIDAAVAEVITQASPTFVTKLLQVARDFSSVARKFGIVSKLTIPEGGVSIDGNLLLKHKLEGVFFTVGGAKRTFMFSTMGVATPEALMIPAQMMGEEKLVIGQHSFPFSYGSVLLVALNQVIIPLVDPAATNLSELIANQVDCHSIGVTMSNYVGIGSVGLYEGACRTGIAAIAAAVEDQIRQIDGTLAQLTLKGDGTLIDRDGDRSVEQMSAGLWEGSMAMAGTSSVLSRPNNKFTAVKMGAIIP